MRMSVAVPPPHRALKEWESGDGREGRGWKLGDGTGERVGDGNHLGMGRHGMPCCSQCTINQQGSARDVAFSEGSHTPMHLRRHLSTLTQPSKIECSPPRHAQMQQSNA